MIKATVKTTVKDYLSEQIKTVNDELRSKPFVRVGILSDSEKHKGEGFNPSAVLDIGTVHEFGSSDGKIPERSFIRSTVDERDSDWKRFIEELRWEMYTKKGMTTKMALQRLGLLIEKNIKEKFRDNDWEPLKYRQGTPLVDTGQLRNSIRFDVVEKG